MTSDTDIANLALSHLGDDANIASLVERSAQASHCNRFMPICRDTLLELHAWKFALRRSEPAALDPWTDTAWPYAYVEPADCLRVLAAHADGYTNDEQQGLEFTTEASEDGQKLILTKLPATLIRWTRRVSDPTLYSPLFVEALARLLAASVAGPLIKGAEGRKASQDQFTIFAQWFQRATGSDANQARRLIEPQAPWITARGGYSAASDSDDYWMGLRDG